MPAASARRLERRGAVVAILGVCDEHLRAVLSDVLRDFGIFLDDDLETLPPDLVLAVVDHDDVQRVLLAAQVLAERSPIVAIGAMGDERLQAHALSLGVAAWYALDTPLDRLRAVLFALLGSTSLS